MSRRFRKKPVVIEAVQFTGTNHAEVFLWAGEDADEFHYDSRYMQIKIDTLEGMMTAFMGDWIIKGVQGEFYPCKPDIFEATYEAVESEASNE